MIVLPSTQPRVADTTSIVPGNQGQAYLAPDNDRMDRVVRPHTALALLQVPYIQGRASAQNC